jgi:hypothetical protein
MQKSLWTKGLVVGIILLFVGTSVLPVLEGAIEDEKNQTATNDISDVSRFISCRINYEKTKTKIIDVNSFGNRLQSNLVIKSNIISINTSNNEERNIVNTDGNWQWAKRAGGTGADIGSDVAVDANGNTFISGEFWGTASFGTTTLTSQGDADMFVAKLDTNGNWQWAKRAGGTGHDYGQRIAMDATGNIYIIGGFFYIATFGTTTLTSQGDEDMFVVKLDTNGNWQWAKRAGGTSYDNGYCIAVDASENTFISGSFNGTASFGTTTLTSQGDEDMFVAKLDTNGNWQWAKRAGGTSGDYGSGVAGDAGGNIYITGFFYGTATFGSTTLTSQGMGDVFVAKLSTSGNWQWAKRAGGTSDDEENDIVVDATGNIYITGCSAGTATFGSTTLTSQGHYDVFVAKLDTNGNWQWAKRAGGTSDDSGFGIKADAGGNIYITGFFYDTASFGTTTLTSQGNMDVFIAKLDTNGNWQWAKRAGGTSADCGYSVAVDAGGNIYITGFFYGTAGFDSITLTSQGMGDVFVAKLSEGSVNHNPNIPRTPSGPTSGRTGASYIYKTNATDPDTDTLKYGWDWKGDGTVDEWSSLVVSGTMDSRSHSWGSPGAYHVEVKAEDEHGVQSGWSPVLNVTIENKPVIEIGPISGVFGVSAVIKNNGITAATNVPWWINVTKGIILTGSHSLGTISELAVNDTTTIKSTNLWGIGSITVDVQVGDVHKQAKAFLLCPLVLGVKQQ